MKKLKKKKKQRSCKIFDVFKETYLKKTIPNPQYMQFSSGEFIDYYYAHKQELDKLPVWIINNLVDYIENGLKYINFDMPEPNNIDIVFESVARFTHLLIRRKKNSKKLKLRLKSAYDQQLKMIEDFKSKKKEKE